MSVQSMAALGTANQIRLARAELKRGINRGEVDLADLLRQPLPDWLHKETVGHLMTALPHLGAKSADRILITVESMRVLDLATPVGDLTPREREGLATALEERYYRR